MKGFVKILIDVFLFLVFKFKMKTSSKSSLLLFSTNLNFVLEKDLQKLNCVLVSFYFIYLLIHAIFPNLIITLTYLKQ